MSAGDYIAIDWGTTNRRIYAMRGDGTPIASERDAHGVLQMAAGSYAEEIAAIRERFGDLPIVAAGMVGSTRGMIEVPYRPAPAGIADLAAGAVEAADRMHVVPGVSCEAPKSPDVMRGEEVQVLGALAVGLANGPALFCQPGTHNKWIETDDRRIVAFSTAMTGELFALLKSHSILADMLAGDATDGPAFREGVRRGAGAIDLPTALFRSRPAVLLGQRAVEDAGSYVSGLLIGADVGAQPGLAGREVSLLASGGLADLYAAAIDELGGAVRSIDSHAAFAPGIHAIWSELR